MGGVLPVTRLYSRHLQPDELAAFEVAPEYLGRLESEIALVRAHLDWAAREHAAHPTLGIVTFRSPGKDGQPGAVSIRPWIDVVRLQLETLRRLEQARAHFLKQFPPPPALSDVAAGRLTFKTLDAVGFDVLAPDPPPRPEDASGD